jgi:hypothetical protein
MLQIIAAAPNSWPNSLTAEAVAYFIYRHIAVDDLFKDIKPIACNREDRTVTSTTFVTEQLTPLVDSGVLAVCDAEAFCLHHNYSNGVWQCGEEHGGAEKAIKVYMLVMLMDPWYPACFR